MTEDDLVEAMAKAGDPAGWDDRYAQRRLRRDNARSAARTVLSAIIEAGCKVMEREPTEETSNAVHHALGGDAAGEQWEFAAHLVRVAWNAAPKWPGAKKCPSSTS